MLGPILPLDIAYRPHPSIYMATLNITQVRSIIRTPGPQKRTMEALGLRRMNQTVQHEATPQIRGMITKVSHLVRVEEA